MFYFLFLALFSYFSAIILYFVKKKYFSYFFSSAFFLHFVFICFRFYKAKHFPTSNMFEFVVLFSFMLPFVYIILAFVYRPFENLKIFVLFFTFMLLSFSFLFSKEITPLIPALQSYWLVFHVTTTIIGEVFFTISFLAALIYLIKYLNEKNCEMKNLVFLELILFLLLAFLCFSLFYLIVNALNFKLNKCLMAFIIGSFIYILLTRFIFKKPLYKLLYPLVMKQDLTKLDEICYKAIAIGFPIFTLGALFFAMLWAHEAWGRFWGWDPKETWALITWLYYSLYLHLRLYKSFLGVKAAWFVVGGFLIIMFNLLVINFVIAGLHSYA